MLFLFNLLFQIVFMTFFYILSLLLSNGSFVDFAWPSSFSLMAFFYIFCNFSYPPRMILLSLLYIVAGVRFMAGWLKRGHLKKEDNRWSQWRALWKETGGFFGIKNEKINTFIFYHAQSLSNGLFMSAPLEIVSRNSDQTIYFLEILGIGLWTIAFCLENIADMQRLRFIVRMKKEGKGWGGINREGLWAYSRHPNYFCELMIWVSYCVYAIPSIEKLDWRVILLICLPYVAYYFLVNFTGIYITDMTMMNKRIGTPYEKEMREYMETTNAFFPWFKSAKKKKN